MPENSGHLSPTAGDITFKVSAEGKVEHVDQMIDHMLATATAIIGTEVVQHGLSSTRWEEGQRQEKCVSTVRIGGITLSIEIEFVLKRRVSRRMINNIVFKYTVPKVWETAGIYLGDGQTLTTPQAPLAQRFHKDIMNGIDAALLEAASPFGTVTDGVPQDDAHRARQLVGTPR